MTPLSSAFVAVSVSTVVSVGAMSAFLPVGTITTRTTRRVASSSPSSSDRRTCGLILRATEYHVGSSNPRSVSKVENSVGNSDEWTQILQLLAFTRSSDVDRARSYLDMSGGDLETAASLFFADTSMGDSEEGDDGASASADSAYEYGNEVSKEYRHGDPVVPATPAVHSQAPLPSSQEPSPVDADSSSDAGSIAHQERTSAIQNGSHANFAAAKRNVAQFNRSCYEGNSITPWKSISGDTLLPENSHAAPVAPAVPEETALPSSQEPPPVDIEAGAEMEAIAHVDTDSEAKTDTDDDAHAKADTRSIAYQERTSAARRNSRANFAAAKRNVAQFNRSCYEGNSITPWKSNSGGSIVATPDSSTTSRKEQKVRGLLMPAADHLSQVDRYGRHRRLQSKPQAHAHADAGSIIHTQQRTRTSQRAFATAKRNVALHRTSSYERNSVTPWTSNAGDGHSNLPTISQPIKAQATSTKPSTPFGDRSSTRYNKGNTVSPWEFKGADEVDEMGDKNRDEEDHENGDEEGDDTHEQQSSTAGTEKIVVSFTDNMPVLFAICSKLIDERSPTATTPSGETASGISKE